MDTMMSHPPEQQLSTADPELRAAELRSALDVIGRFFAGKPAESLDDVRANLDSFGASFALPAGTAVNDLRVGGVPCRRIDISGAAHDRLVLYLHGGGYVFGSAKSHTRQAADIGVPAGASVLSVDYRLAPEHPFPAQIEDCVSAYRGLLDQQPAPPKIAFAGDSAGATLVVSVMLRLRELGLPLPVCGVCLSPWTNLVGDSETLVTNRHLDPLQSADQLDKLAAMYLAGANKKDPLASPAFADLRGLPPLLIQVGTHEILLNDARQLAIAATRDGVDVTLEEWPDMIHNWQMLADYLTDGRRANARIGQFIAQHFRS